MDTFFHGVGIFITVIASLFGVIGAGVFAAALRNHVSDEVGAKGLLMFILALAWLCAWFLA